MSSSANRFKMSRRATACCCACSSVAPSVAIGAATCSRTRARRLTPNSLEYETLLTQLTASEGHTPDWPYMRLTILAGIHSARAAVAWANESLSSLDTPRRGNP